MVDGGEVQRFDSSHNQIQQLAALSRCTSAALVWFIEKKKNGQKELTVSAHRAQECIVASEAVSDRNRENINTREQEQVAAEEHSNDGALVFWVSPPFIFLQRSVLSSSAR